MEAYDITPVELPNLYHGAPVRVYGRYRGAGALAANAFDVKLTAEVRGKPYQQHATLSQGDGKNPEIERMWAQHRIKQLLREPVGRGGRSQVVDQVVALAEDYSIVTEYTSFIVLENEEEYQRWKIDRKNANRLDRDRKKREALDKELQRLRQESFAKQGPGAKAKKIEYVSTKAPSAETPEPSSALLLLLGAGSLLLRRRRT